MLLALRLVSGARLAVKAEAFHPALLEDAVPLFASLAMKLIDLQLAPRDSVAVLVD